MKFEKFISLSLGNASIFLIFASIITSCQKKAYEKYGHFSDLKIIQRSPANVENQQIADQFVSYQDPKQIFLYCSLNSPKRSECYDHHSKQVLSNYYKKHSELTTAQKDFLIDKFSYEKVEAEINKVKSLILDKVDPQLFQLVSKRSEFCNKNSTVNLKRCLKQFKNKDTLTVLNKYQTKESKLNAHEYLYVQNFLMSELESRLEAEYSSLTNPMEKPLNFPAYDHKGVQKDTLNL